jgi:hypothetical protein
MNCQLRTTVSCLPPFPKVRLLTENNIRQGFFERPDAEGCRRWPARLPMGLHPIRLSPGLKETRDYFLEADRCGPGHRAFG